jgi:hypothetical protein
MQVVAGTDARCVWRQRRTAPSRHGLRCRADKQRTGSRGASTPPEPSPALKALWYASEQFGNALAAVRGTAGRPTPLEVVPLSPAERLASLRADYEVNYFVSGRGEMRAYAPDCLFADAFASFRGTQRFKNNVANLGGLLEDVSIVLTSWEERGGELEVNWRFAGTIGVLPWSPRLACSGGTTHVYGATGLVEQHIERWDIDPAVVVRQLFTPTRAKKRA